MSNECLWSGWGVMLGERLVAAYPTREEVRKAIKEAQLPKGLVAIQKIKMVRA